MKTISFTIGGYPEGDRDTLRLIIRDRKDAVKLIQQLAGAVRVMLSGRAASVSVFVEGTKISSEHAPKIREEEAA